MSMRRSLRRFFLRLRGQKLPDLAEMVTRMALDSDEVELGCDEVLALLDEYTEAVLRGEDVGRLYPLVMRHLERCGDCREEHQALLRILQAGV